MTDIDVYNDNHDAIQALLLGRRVAKVSDHELRLDNGVVLVLPDTDGGCSCGSGDYALTTLNGVDNVITSVEFVDDPAGDGYDPKATGKYSIFVFADNQRVNLATWEGNDGNGYYGTGYRIIVRREVSA